MHFQARILQNDLQRINTFLFIFVNISNKLVLLVPNDLSLIMKADLDNLVAQTIKIGIFYDHYLLEIDGLWVVLVLADPLVLLH